MANSILVNINRCTGCWSCSISCKVAYDLDVDEYREFVRTIGGGKPDEPGGKWPNLYMKWMPIYTQDCLLCHGDKYTGGKPFCVNSCPTKALSYGDLSDPESEASKEVENLRDKGYKLYELPVWERTHANILYAENGI